MRKETNIGTVILIFNFQGDSLRETSKPKIESVYCFYIIIYIIYIISISPKSPFICVFVIFFFFLNL